MRKTYLIILTLALFGVLALAGDTLTLKGDIIDNRCVGRAGDNVSEFVKTHTKQCALMTPCVASGYSIFADGKLHKFDLESNKKIEEFLIEDTSKLQVVITAEKAGEELSLLTIVNQE